VAAAAEAATSACGSKNPVLRGMRREENLAGLVEISSARFGGSGLKGGGFF
jgi:hypothetical protein